ncbi:MAG: hypothetical protein PXY39_09570 [archaeon]|nr:hypothetical protein [archaeon]
MREKERGLLLGAGVLLYLIRNVFLGIAKSAKPATALVVKCPFYFVIERCLYLFYISKFWKSLATVSKI